MPRLGSWFRLSEMDAQKPIVFFDGFCGLCSEFVDFVMKIDKHEKFVFSPLQGATAERLLTESERKDLDSVVVYFDGNKFKKSQAVFQVFKNVGGPWSALGGLSILPRFLTDAAYTVVAKYRYKIFGKKDVCRLPTPEERRRFLD